MIRCLVYLLTAVLLTCTACTELKLPSSSQMDAIFVSKVSVKLKEPAAPDSVPVLAISEENNWHELCDQCHIGPNYSSHSTLAWGHKPACLAGTTCAGCHGTELHLSDVRGKKQVCIDCHLARGLAVSCKTCHAPAMLANVEVHQAGFLGQHGASAKKKELDCMKCHGSEKWCLACHGLPMPHPEDIVQSHPNLVQGQPGLCNNCHGTQSCIRCHLALGVKVKGQ